MKIRESSFIADAGRMIIVACILVVFAALAVSAGPDDDLMTRAKSVFGPLPSSMPSADNQITPEKVRLGNILFFETRISVDRTVSCAKCHPPAL